MEEKRVQSWLVVAERSTTDIEYTAFLRYEDALKYGTKKVRDLYRNDSPEQLEKTVGVFVNCPDPNDGSHYVRGVTVREIVLVKED